VLAVALARRDPRHVRGLVLLSLPAFRGRHETTVGFQTGPTPGGWIARNMALTAVTCVFMRRVMGRVLPLVVRDALELPSGLPVHLRHGEMDRVDPSSALEEPWRAPWIWFGPICT
jgi:hypothetical protein